MIEATFFFEGETFSLPTTFNDFCDQKNTGSGEVHCVICFFESLVLRETRFSRVFVPGFSEKVGKHLLIHLMVEVSSSFPEKRQFPKRRNTNKHITFFFLGIFYIPLSKSVSQDSLLLSLPWNMQIRGSVRGNDRSTPDAPLLDPSLTNRGISFIW